MTSRTFKLGVWPIVQIHVGVKTEASVSEMGFFVFSDFRWYGHVLRRDDDSVLRVAMNLEVTGKRKRGRPKKTWKKQVEEETEKIGLKKEDALRRDKWRDGVREIAEGMG